MGIRAVSAKVLIFKQKRSKFLFLSLFCNFNEKTAMRDAVSVKNEKTGRIKPTIFNPRYYHLRELKRCTLAAIQQYVAVSPGKILVDYGCGSMPYRSYFEPYVSEYIGADIAENSAADVFLAEGRLQMPDDSVDIVLSTQVLEHVTDPLVYLQESCRVLKKGGLLLLSTHGIWRYHPDPTDYWRWTGDGLKKILADNGFQVKEVYGVMGLASMGLLLFQDAFLYKLPRFLRYVFVPVMQTQMILFDKAHSKADKMNNAGVFLMVAQKK
jgi:SAM-dependent methyltransferase